MFPLVLPGEHLLDAIADAGGPTQPAQNIIIRLTTRCAKCVDSARQAGGWLSRQSAARNAGPCGVDRTAAKLFRLWRGGKGPGNPRSSARLFICRKLLRRLAVQRIRKQTQPQSLCFVIPRRRQMGFKRRVPIRSPIAWI